MNVFGWGESNIFTNKIVDMVFVTTTISVIGLCAFENDVLCRCCRCHNARMSVKITVSSSKIRNITLETKLHVSLHQNCTYRLATHDNKTVKIKCKRKEHM